jgi:plastocyanin
MKKAATLGYILSAMIFLGFSVGCKKSSDNGYNSSSSSTSTPPANEVWMQNTAFNPTSITVTVNTTVKWTNKDGMTHTVTSDSSLFDSGNIGSGNTYTHQFTAAGTYPYRCTLHSGMTGKVIVH